MKIKTKGWIAGIIWFLFTLFLVMTLVDCQYVKPDIRLMDSVIGSMRSDGTTFIQLCAVNLGGKTAYDVMANTTILEVGGYQNYLGTIEPGTQARFEIDLPGVEWGSDLDVSTISVVFRWE